MLEVPVGGFAVAALIISTMVIIRLVSLLHEVLESWHV